MNDEQFSFGIKIVVIVAFVLLACEIILVMNVLKEKEVPTSVLDEIDVDVSNSILLQETDYNALQNEVYYVEES